MKEILKNSLSLFGRIIVVDLMCFFLVISLSVLATAAFSENIGYIAYGTTSESEKSTELYRHYYADGDDTKREAYEEDGYTITESKIRSKVSRTGNAVFLTVSAIFSLVLTVSFIYPKFWAMGTKDSNLVHFKHKKEDKLKGLKCGLIATIPGVIVLLLFFFVLRDVPVAIYRFLNCNVYTFVDLIVGKASTFKDVSFIQFIGLFLLKAVIPLSAYAGYMLGYKNISISEKFIYKKKNEA